MNNQLAKTKSDLVKPPGEDNPFAILPPEWIKSVSYFAMCKASLLKSPIALCATLKVWIADGLTLDEGKAIFRRLMAPEFAAGHKWETDLMVDLAKMVAALNDRKRRRADAEKRKASEANPAGSEGQVVSLADAFRMPGGRP